MAIRGISFGSDCTMNKRLNAMNQVKQAIFEKIKEYEAYKIDPKHQTEMEQNAIAVVLRELRYLDQIAEYDLPSDCIIGGDIKYCKWRLSDGNMCKHCK